MFLRKITRQVVLIAVLALILSSCNVGAGAASPTTDINAVNTAIVGTTIAQFSVQFTQTALAIPPSNTPAPTDTAVALPTFGTTTQNGSALPTVSFDSTSAPAFTQVVLPTTAPTQSLGDACLNSVFEADITIPDGQIVKGGETLNKTWKIRNSASCTWDEGFRLVHIGGSIPNDNIQTPIIEFQSKDSVASGEAINLTVRFNAPCAAGKYEAHWRMQDDGGYYFGTILSVYIEVQGKTGGCV